MESDNKILSTIKQLSKFVIAGCLVIAVELILLFLFTDIMNIWYVISSMLGYIGSTVISFTIHKFWTFNHDLHYKIKKEMILYFIIIFVGTFLNAKGVQILVEDYYLNYLIAQLIIAPILGIGNFLFYKLFVFIK